jgi:hypothetical protein
MRSYRFARRSFLAAVGGAFGLESLLNGFEAMAAGAAAPPRFLMTHWPVGTLKWAFLPNDGAKPNGIGTITKYSQILQPFADAGLQNDMTLIWGLRPRLARAARARGTTAAKVTTASPVGRLGTKSCSRR